MELVDMVRIMNCNYSNLIEGHNTKPKDIERVMAGAELEEATRPLALEEKAHVIIQREIDGLNFAGELPVPTHVDFISWVHRRFYEEMPDKFKILEHPGGNTIPIIPGQFRVAADQDVVVGRHQTTSSTRVHAS